MLTENALREIEVLIDRYPSLKPQAAAIKLSVETIVASFRGGGKLLTCGNGGSAADSQHIVGELMKGFVLRREIAPQLQRKLKESYPEESANYIANLQGALPAISLVNEVALTTAFGNDQASELAFAQQVLGYGRPGDVLLAITTSGNSPNVLHAARLARVLGVKVIGMTGRGGGKLRALSDVLIDVPSDVTYQIQELHLPVYHALCLATEAEMFD